MKMQTLHLATATVLFGALLTAAAAQTASFEEVRLAKPEALREGNQSRDGGQHSGIADARCDEAGCKEARDSRKSRDDRTRKALRDECPVARLPGPLELASRINAFEAFIGIRAGQLDAWRNYTDALQAMPIGPESERHDEAAVAAATSDLLAQSAALAREATAEGARASQLTVAGEALMRTLNDEQKKRLDEAGPLLPAKCPGKVADATSGTAGHERKREREEHAE